MLPNVFIAGAQKSGTTSLCYALEQHSQALVSVPKEPAFFSRTANLKEPERYEACFPVRLGEAPRAIIDGSNAYMVDPLAPSRIMAMLGEDLRFVFCLREPAGRAISAFWHQAKKSRERRPLTEVLRFASSSLKDAVAEEEERLERAAQQGLIDPADGTERFDDPLWNFRYLRNSVYADDLERFRAVFGAHRIKVLLFEELVRDPEASLSSVATFLDLDPEGFPADLHLHHNATALMRAPALADALKKLPGRSLLRRLPGYASMRAALFFRAPPPTDDALKAVLRQLIAPEVTRLRSMLDCDFALWGSVDCSQSANITGEQ
jgi:hypothetical protein